MENHSQQRSRAEALYVCNCNGIRARDVQCAIDAGATRPKDIFTSQGCKPQCAKCVCEMREMIQESQTAFAMAAE